jgi:molybdate transport system regulatory protein
MARLRVSIVFGSGARIGPGKAKLLESIRDTGSISAAARDMGMSYKRAWPLLDSMNQAFTEPVVSAAPGGAGGGGATLTPFGAEVECEPDSPHSCRHNRGLRRNPAP